MTTLLEQMTAFFEGDEWFPAPIPNEPALAMGFRGDSGAWSCVAVAREEARILQFYSISPIPCPPARLAAVSELMNRLNCELPAGCFELNWDAGEVRLRTAVDVEDVDFHPNLLRNLVHFNVTAFDHYLPAILGVIHGGLSPTDALSRLESQSNQP